MDSSGRRGGEPLLRSLGLRSEGIFPNKLASPVRRMELVQLV